MTNVKRYTAVELRFATRTGCDYVSAADYDALAAKLAEQHQGEPVAWTWQGTLDELKGYCSDGITVFKHKGPGVPIPLYAHADTGEVERLRNATAFVQRLVDCTGMQQSMATGYLRDILDALKGNPVPSAPVERDEGALIEALRTCEKWFIKHSPTAPLIGGLGDAEHPMLTHIRAALERKLTND